MAALRALAASFNVKVADTLKFYHRRFPYRVLLDAEGYAKKTLSPSQAYRTPTIHAEVLEKIGLSGETYAVHSLGRTAVYFEVEEDACRFLDIVCTHCVVVNAPVSAAALAAIAPDHTRLETQLRDTLWWNKYRYRVTFKKSLDDNGGLDDIVAWMKDYNEVSPTDNRIELHYSSPRLAYFADENDLLFFKLVFHEHISKLEKTLLIKDFPHACEPAEGAH